MTKLLGLSLFAYVLLFTGRITASSEAVIENLPEGSFSLTISSTSAIAHVGSPIKMNIAVTVGNHDILWEAEKGAPEYFVGRFHMLLDGKDVPKTRFYRGLIGELLPDDDAQTLNRSHVISTLKSGSSRSFEIDLTQLYNITEPGKYVVSVSRFDANTKTIVLSNRITLNILR